MIKSNSARARVRIRDYIRANYFPEGYDEYQEETSVHKIAENILNCFYDEKVRNDKRRMIYEDLFIEWMAGLPTILNADYYYHGTAKDVLGEILEETQGERDRFTEQQAEEKLSRMIWGELLRLAPIWPFC